MAEPWAAVVARWNPQGSALLRAVADGSSSAALLIGADDANTLLLRTELARLEPRVELGGPVAEPERPSAAMTAVVVLDAGSPLGVGTLTVVERLHVAGSRLVFVLNGTHAHPDWRAVADRNRELLAPVLGGPPELIPVSPRLAVAARTAGDAALLDRSGLGALHGRLIAATGAAGHSSETVDRVLAETRQRIRDQIAVLRSGAEEARLRAERAALTTDRDGDRTRAMAALRNRLQLARVELLHEIGARVRSLHTAARTELDKYGVPECPDRLQRSVEQLTVELDEVVRARLAELDRQLNPLIDAVSGPAAGTPPRPDPPPPIGPDPEPRHRGVEDHLMVALGASAGFGLGRWVVAPLTALPALHYASVPATLLLGGGVAYWVVRARAQVADRAHMRQWIADTVVNVRAQLEQRVATALVVAESELTDQVVRAGTARAVEADRRAAEIAAQLRRLATESQARSAACDRDLAALM